MYWYDRIPTDDVIGMYPIINEETAFKKLMNGDYVTTVCVDEYLPDGLTEDEVFSAEYITDQQVIFSTGFHTTGT